MSQLPEHFDPYWKWLGIQPKDQPPTHYRLLGIDPFESDDDVIATAADARMMHIKTFATGKSSALSQRILNELAAAKVCLLNPQKKAAYDLTLRRKMEYEAAAAHAASAQAARAKKSPVKWIASAAGGAGVLVVVALVAWLAGRSGETPPAPPLAQQTVEKASLAPVNPPAPPVTVPPPPPPPALAAPTTSEPPPPVEPPQPVEPPPAAVKPDGPGDGVMKATFPEPGKPPEAAVPLPAPEMPLESPAPGMGIPLTPTPTMTPPGGPLAGSSPVGPRRPNASGGSALFPPSPAPPPRVEEPEFDEPPPEPAKLPPPETVARQAAEKLVRSVFERDLQNAKTREQRVLLVDKLTQQAVESKQDKAARYVMLNMAADLAASAGDLARALDAADELAATYNVKGAELKFQTLTKVNETIAKPGGAANYDIQGMADAALEMADEAILDNEFDVATKATRLANGLGKRSKNTQIQRAAVERTKTIEKAQERFRTIQDAQATLARAPNDPKANLAVGRWLCFVKGDWKQGLPMLARSSDAKLAALAKDDLEANKQSPDAKNAMALRWWQIADEEDAAIRPNIQLHAGFWYRKALPGLTDLARKGAEQRLSEVAALANTKARKRVRAAIEPGNVALAQNGATVSGVGDMYSNRYVNDGSYAYHTYAPLPATWVITLPKVYSLRAIRLKFHEFYTDTRHLYAISTSVDGENFEMLFDRRQGQWFGWQEMRFPARPVKAIKLEVINRSDSRTAMVTELEAYCAPPTHPLGAPPPGVLSPTDAGPGSVAPR